MAFGNIRDFKSGLNICSARKQTATDRVKARRVFSREIVVSCGDSDQGWRTKLYFRSGESVGDSPSVQRRLPKKKWA